MDFRSLGVALASCLLIATPALAQRSMSGDWVSQDKKAVITIAPCGASYCGRIARILVRDPNWNGRDVNNPDPKLRNRSVVGLAILHGFKPDGAGLAGGRIYDPNSGKTYASKLKLNPDGSLKVSGCIAFFCQSQRWTRPR